MLFLLWGAAGVYAFYAQATMTPAALAALPGYDRRFHAALPVWFNWVYGIATWGGVLGSVVLLGGRRWAAGLYAAALLAIAIQFGWVFAATDLIAVKGAAATVPFPLVIFAVALWQLATARHGIARGWLR
ncbi:MAG: hypothetical protein DI632_02475 [Sphingomonas hengshuiensis]|uniref:Sugar transporter n=1 Tax=Sphingomonas hengshuiensis TaxID=1609977 RepID=A0A2W4ZDJ4_9SPHN|nr:MAG: hypothetical protein DI632_02475 [Sphingomonas hengshuiensis]